jgi:hypothetical protein
MTQIESRDLAPDLLCQLAHRKSAEKATGLPCG